MTTPFTLNLQVSDVDDLNPLIRRLVLRAPDGGPLPGFTAGSHIRVRVHLPSGANDWRHYSLVNFDTAPGATRAPLDYTIAVRREDDGRGGSRFMHQLKAGEVLTVESPKNDFPLGSLNGAAVLIAGGIGVTPLISMAAERKREGQEVRMTYAGRTLELMAFVPELKTLLGSGLLLHSDQSAGTPLNVHGLLDSCAVDDVLYVCGPQLMLDTILTAAQARGWSPGRVRFELFTAPSAQEGDHAFELVLKQSGKTLQVPADQTILDCMVEHGCDALFDCKRGECGICVANVLEGGVDHRDHVLTETEKASGKVIQVCVSRAKGGRLVLDL